MSLKVAILGASDKPDRFAYKAFRMLREHGHQVLPVSPKLSELEGVAVVPDLASLKEPVDTLTVYVGAPTSTALAEPISRLHPRRVIFNPGDENPVLAERLQGEGVEVVEHCTLVMLQTGEF